MVSVDGCRLEISRSFYIDSINFLLRHENSLLLWQREEPKVFIDYATAIISKDLEWAATQSKDLRLDFSGFNTAQWQSIGPFEHDVGFATVEELRNYAGYQIKFLFGRIDTNNDGKGRSDKVPEMLDGAIDVIKQVNMIEEITAGINYPSISEKDFPIWPLVKVHDGLEPNKLWKIMQIVDS